MSDFLQFVQSTIKASVHRALVLAAHPDDEVVGLGGQLSKLEDVYVVHATDGAPRNMIDAIAYGFSTREAYAAARRLELEKALQLCGIAPSQLIRLDIVDQEASFKLFELSNRLADILRDLQQEVIFCPAYEGGHPDHDAISFAAHVSRYILRRGERPVPVLFEYALYHAAGDGMATFKFLDGDNMAPVIFELSQEECNLKRRMMNFFQTQRQVIEAFPVGVEALRIAPAYDFTIPPHPGRLHYEKFD